MPRIHAEPWIPPAEPALGRLAMAAADAEGLRNLSAWPEVRGNGVAFGALPPFLCWRGFEEGEQLLLLQARELGAVVPGARSAGLPEGWLEALDLAALARPLRRHPAFPAGLSVHVVRVAGPGDARIRGTGPPPAALLAQVLARLTGLDRWSVRPEGPAAL